MKIAICGSMMFYKEMQDAEKELRKLGHEVFLPEGTEQYSSSNVNELLGISAKRKIEHDFIRAHYRKIKEADAILVLNYKKGGIENYIGGNSFLEIGFAYILDKKIYLLNQIPDTVLIKAEVEAVQPIIINGDFSKI